MLPKFFLMSMIITALIVISCSDEENSVDEKAASALDTVNVVITKDSSCFIASKLKANVKITSKATGKPVSGFYVTIESRALYRVACGSPGLAEWTSGANGSGTTNGSGTVLIDLTFPNSEYPGAYYKYIDYVRAKK